MTELLGRGRGKLTPEARTRREAKNARWRNRTHPVGSQHGLDMPVPGANRRIIARLFTKGNREQRGRA